MSNTPKYLSYKEAWRRVDAAIEGGYYFEAVTICESIISDRLFSYVTGVSPESKLKIKSSLGDLIAEWKKTAGDSLPKGLADEVDAWRLDRNSIVHGLVKSAPGRPTDDVGCFLEKAKEAAIAGKRLARQVSSWHKKRLRELKKV